MRMAQTYAVLSRFDRSRFGELTDAFKLNPKANLGTFSRACAARVRRCQALGLQDRLPLSG